MRDKGEYLFTSESVSEGHPDKVADRISDTVLDAFLAADPQSRVACETLVTTNRVVLAGEVRGPESVTPDLLIEHARERDPRHRLRPGRLQLAQRADRLPAARPEHRHRRRRGQRRQQGRGRGRPGHHVRLRLHRDPGADAGADPLRAPDPAAHQGRPAGGRPGRRRAAAGREEPGHAEIRRRQAGPRHQHRALDPARRGHGPGRDQAASEGPDRRDAARRAGCAPTTSST